MRLFSRGFFVKIFVFVIFYNTVFVMEQRLARSRCFLVFLFLSTFFIQALSLSYKLDI